MYHQFAPAQNICFHRPDKIWLNFHHQLLMGFSWDDPHRWSESACRKADCVANTHTHCWSCLDSNLTRINKIGLRLDSDVWIYKTGKTLGPQKINWLSWVQSFIHSSKLKVVCVAEDGTNQLGVTICVCVCFSQMLQINNQVENIWTFST